MKKLILYTFLFSISFSTAQKKELRNANKFFTSGEYASAIDLLDSSKEIFDSATINTTNGKALLVSSYVIQTTLIFDGIFIFLAILQPTFSGLV